MASSSSSVVKIKPLKNLNFLSFSTLHRIHSMAAYIDPRSGFNRATKTFHSLRPASPLPPPSLNPLSFSSFAFSLLPSPLPSKPALISSSSSSDVISFADLISSVTNLSSSLSSTYFSDGGPRHVAFILCPPSLHIPILYFSLLSLGVVVSPSNPLSSPSEISRQFHLLNPTIVFATSSTAPKLLPTSQLPVVLLDSPHFLTLLSNPTTTKSANFASTSVQQSDSAAILFSSGTTGKVKGVVLTHRNLIGGAAMMSPSAVPGGVMMVTVPLFHVFGFLYSLAGVALGQAVVIQTERYEVGRMMRAVERLAVTNLVVAPPAVLGMVRFWVEGETKKRVDLRSLSRVSCGGGPIGVGLIRRFFKMIPNVLLVQVRVLAFRI